MPDAASQLNIQNSVSLPGEYLVGLKKPTVLELASEQGSVPRTPDEHRAVQQIMIDHTESACRRIDEWVAGSAENGPLEIIHVYRGIGQIMVRGTQEVVKKMEKDLADLVMCTCRNIEGRIL
jgi:hypothetical protein